MKRTVLLVCVIIGLATAALADTLGDIDNDGSVGLPEAVHALQVSAGVRSPSLVPTYNLAEYYPEGDFLYLERRITGDEVSNSTVLFRYYHETVDGRDVLVEEVMTGLGVGSKTYLVMDAPYASVVGYYDRVSAGNVWFVAPIVIGSTDLEKGDVFYSFAQRDNFEPAVYYEYIFSGLEDVIVAAGTFVGCLKKIRKSSAGGSFSVAVLFYAKDVGMVKRIDAGYRTLELTNARIGETTYPIESQICTGQASGGFPNWTFAFSPQVTPTNATLTAYDSVLKQTFLEYVRSEDGIHFTADPDAYGGTPPDISFTAENGTISGSFAGTYSCVP